MTTWCNNYVVIFHIKKWWLRSDIYAMRKLVKLSSYEIAVFRHASVISQMWSCSFYAVFPSVLSTLFANLISSIIWVAHPGLPLRYGYARLFNVRNYVPLSQSNAATTKCIVDDMFWGMLFADCMVSSTTHLTLKTVTSWMSARNPFPREHSLKYCHVFQSTLTQNCCCYARIGRLVLPHPPMPHQIKTNLKNHNCKIFARKNSKNNILSLPPKKNPTHPHPVFFIGFFYIYPNLK